MWRLLFSWLSHVRLFGTPCTVACQAPLSMGFSRQENWSGWPFPFPIHVYFGIFGTLKMNQMYFSKFVNMLFPFYSLFGLFILGLHCCDPALSTCGCTAWSWVCSAQASHCSGFSCFGRQASSMRASVVKDSRLQSTASAVFGHGLSCSAASSRNWEGICVPYTGRHIPIQCITRDVLKIILYN